VLFDVNDEVFTDIELPSEVSVCCAVLYPKKVGLLDRIAEDGVRVLA